MYHGKHEDKMMPATGTKLSPAQQAAFDHQMAKGHGLTGEEANEVGRQVLLEAEARVRADPLRRRMDAAGEMTADERKAIAEAMAAHEAAVARRVAARRAAMDAETRVKEEFLKNESIIGYAPSTSAQFALEAAASELRRAELDADIEVGRLARVRGQIENRRAKARFVLLARDGGIA